MKNQSIKNRAYTPVIAGKATAKKPAKKPAKKRK